MNPRAEEQADADEDGEVDADATQDSESLDGLAQARAQHLMRRVLVFLVHLNPSFHFTMHLTDSIKTDRHIKEFHRTAKSDLWCACTKKALP